MNYLGEDFGVSDNDDAVFGPGEGDVEPAGVVEEANALVLVGANTRHNNQILLSALEGVDARHLDLLVQLGVQRALVLHVLHLQTQFMMRSRRTRLLEIAYQVSTLALVRSDDSDLLGFHARLQEASGDLLHVGRLGAVQVGGARAGDLLLALSHVEEHGLVGLRPREVDSLQTTLL
jgi:hypothetical protein